MSEDTRPEPGGRARETARGTPVDLDGDVWLFADYVPGTDPAWDMLYDQNILARQYDQAGLLMGGMLLLVENYRLTADEAVELVLRVPFETLRDCVEIAMFGAQPRHRTWSDWVLSSLWANGIDPDRVPPEQVRNVLHQLVCTGRAVPAAEFISSAEAAAARRGLLKLAARNGNS